MNSTTAAVTTKALADSRRGKRPQCRPTILIVEDEGLIAEDIRQTVTHLGYEPVAVAATGAEAIEAAAKFGPSLALVDIRLKGKMDGIEAAKVMRERFCVPVVFLTSHSDEKTLERATDVGPFGYVLKPFSDRDLHTSIRVALQRHALEAKLAQRTELLEAVLGAMGDAVLAVDPQGKVILANESAAQIGVDKEEILLGDRTTPCPPDRTPVARALGGEVVRQAELFKRSSEQAAGQWLSTNATPLLDSQGVIRGCVTVTRDVTELKKVQLELERMSIVDELTGLYNRRGFQTLAHQHLKLVRRTGRAPAIVFVDINDMKWINDNLGHKEGDQAICDTASVLKESFRDSDIVARLGGDEFVVLAIDAAANAELLRSRVQANVEKLNASRQNRYRVSLSVGVLAYDPENPQPIDVLIANADKLMYEQKKFRRVHGSLVMRAVRESPISS